MSPAKWGSFCLGLDVLKQRLLDLVPVRSRYNQITWSNTTIFLYIYVKIWIIDHNLSSQKQCQKLGKIFTGPAFKLLLSFTAISDVYMSFIPNKITFTKHCLTQRSFEVHWVRQCLVNFTGMVGIVNATVYWTNFHLTNRPILALPYTRPWVKIWGVFRQFCRDYFGKKSPCPCSALYHIS